MNYTGVMSDVAAEIYIDGASRNNPGRSGIGVLFKMDDKETEYLNKYIGIGSNNRAEYLALLMALKHAKKRRAAILRIYSDSQLIVNQVNGTWKVGNADLKPLCKLARETVKSFKKVELTYIPRHLNKRADALANQAIDNADFDDE